MAQAFDIPTGNWTTNGGCPLSEPSQGVPRRFQTAAPVRSDPSAGSMSGIWVRHRLAASTQILSESNPRRPKFRARRSCQG